MREAQTTYVLFCVILSFPVSNYGGSGYSVVQKCYGLCILLHCPSEFCLDRQCSDRCGYRTALVKAHLSTNRLSPLSRLRSPRIKWRSRFRTILNSCDQRYNESKRAVAGFRCSVPSPASMKAAPRCARLAVAFIALGGPASSSILHCHSPCEARARRRWLWHIRWAAQLRQYSRDLDSQGFASVTPH